MTTRAPRRRTLRSGAVLGLVAACAAGATAAVASFVPASGGSTASVPVAGPIPPSAMSGGGIDWSQVPSFVPVTSDGTVVGYVKRADLMPVPQGQPIPGQVPSSSEQPPAAGAGPQAPVVTVYGQDLSTVVGHEYPGKGFVPLGVDPSTVPSVAPAGSSAPAGS
ncbi:MAG TPA: hypothetical protein VKV36_11455 [Acidimicrobiales bacterium]|nr:hypothetical protein [Acidimicrobiales bacterium]HLH46002.1 hypothetical protein [Acidimicrobiales bacterium]